MLLQSTRTRNNLKYEGHRIVIFPDYTQRVQDQRRTFLAVKRRMREAEVKYSLLYPAKLQIKHMGRALFFGSAAEASDRMDAAGGLEPCRNLQSNSGPPRDSIDSAGRRREHTERGQHIDTNGSGSLRVCEDGTLQVVAGTPDSDLTSSEVIPDTNVD